MSHDTITPIIRGLLSAAAPQTGTRSTGTVLVTNQTASPVTLPPNRYLVPTIVGDGGAARELDEQRLIKTDLNPTTETAFATGGDWTIPASSSAAVAVRSALGGAKHNLAAGTVLRWDPPLAGLAPTVTVQAPGLAGGAGPTELGGIQSAAIFDQFGPAQFQDIFQAGLGLFPALMLVWLGDDPVEQVVAGTRQGSTRIARGRRMFRETIGGYLIASNSQSAGARRREAVEAMTWLTDLWTDRMRNDDGEQLSAGAGGVEIQSRRIQIRDPRWSIYEIALTVQLVLTITDARSFNPWTKTRIRQATEDQGTPAVGPILIPNQTVDMT